MMINNYLILVWRQCSSGQWRRGDMVWSQDDSVLVSVSSLEFQVLSPEHWHCSSGGQAPPVSSAWVVAARLNTPCKDTCSCLISSFLSTPPCSVKLPESWRRPWRFVWWPCPCPHDCILTLVTLVWAPGTHCHCSHHLSGHDWVKTTVKYQKLFGGKLKKS